MRVCNTVANVVLGAVVLCLSWTVSAQTSLAELMRSAERGEAASQAELGSAYINGRGVPQDITKGIMWLSKASSQSHAGAELELGSLYYRGAGVPNDEAEALRWFQRSAEHGNDRAQALMGLSYKMGGASTPQDYSKAAKWFRMAARQKNAEAQINLAEMFNAGVITEREADWHRPDGGKAETGRVKRPRPLSLAEVQEALRSGITNRRVSTLVQIYGVDFLLTEKVRGQLTSAGADADLLAIISQNKR